MSLVGTTKSSLPYYVVPSATQAGAQVTTVEDLQALSNADQVSYVEANGTGSPPALLLPTRDGTGESLASLAPSRSAVDVTAAPADVLSLLARTPTGSPGDTPTAVEFQGWAAGLQTYYFDQKASGSPLALFLPNGTGQALLTASQTGALQVSAAPDQFWANLFGTAYNGTKPQDPASRAFFDGLGAQSNLQAYYFAQKATGSPQILLLSDQNGPALALLASDGTVHVASATDQALADLTGKPFDGSAPEAAPAAQDFAGWDPALRASYFAQNAAGSPPALVLPDGTGRALALLEGDDVVVERLPDAFWADLTGKAVNGTAPQLVPALSAFERWSPAVQAYFLALKGQGSDKTVALQDDVSPQSTSYLFATLDSSDRVRLSPDEHVPGFAAALSASSVGSKYDPATLEQFHGWSSAYQAYYLTAKGGGALFLSSVTPTPDGVRQASLSASGGVVYSRVQSLTDLWNATTSAPSAAAVQAQAQTLTADVFATWPLASQLSYLQRNGSGSPPALLLPTAAGGQVLVSVAPGSNVVEITTPPDAFLTNLHAQPSATPSALTLAQFNALTSVQQTAYLASRPDAVTLDKFGKWTTADQTAYLTTRADTVTLAQFQSWPSQFQIYYLASKGAGSPPALTFYEDARDEPGNRTREQYASLSRDQIATVSSDGMSVSFTPIGADPYGSVSYVGSPLPSSFFELTPAEQLQFYGKQTSAIQNGVLMLAGADLAKSAVITLYLPGSTIKVALPATFAMTSDGTKYDAEADYSTFASGTASSTAFDTWPPQVQAAYVLQQSAASFSKVPAATYPKVAVLNGATVAIVPFAGATASVVADASLAKTSFGAAYGGATPSPSDFLQWPYACQLAWLLKQPTSPVTLGTNPNAIQLALNADGSGFQAAMATDLAKLVGQTDAGQPLTDAQRAVAVAAIDFSLFGKVASPLLQAQLLATLADPGSAPPVITIAANSATPNLITPAIISGGSAATGQGLTIEVAPSDYGTAPAALTPAAFMAWSPAVRQSYVLSRVTAPLPGTVLATTTPSTVVPPFYVGSGADVLSVTFSQTDGTLQVTLPQTLANVVTSGTATTALAGTLLPYYALPGSAVGTSSAVNDAVSAALYPILDGSGGAHNVVMSAQQKQDFAQQPSALPGSTFAGWPTALQLQYLRAYQAPGTPLTIGSGSDTLDALMQTTAQAGAVPKVYVVQNLQKSDIGMMSYPDQLTLAKSKAFTAIANGLGLIPDGGTTAALTGNDVPDPNAGLTTASTSTAKLSAFGFVQTMFVTALNTIDHPTQLAAGALPDGNMPAADRKVFEDEVNLLRRQTFGSPLPTSQQNQSGGQAIFSPKDIQDKLTAIVQRFTRANAFSTATNGATGSGYYVVDGMAGQETFTDSVFPGYSTQHQQYDFWYNNTLSGGGDLGDFYHKYLDITQDDPHPATSAESLIVQALQGATVPSNGLPFTISNLNVQLQTTNSGGGDGDHAVVNSLTLQEVPQNSPADDWVFSAGDKKYRLVDIAGYTIAAGTQTPTGFFYPYPGNQPVDGVDGNKQLVQPIGNFFGYWSNSDNGKALLSDLKDRFPAYFQAGSNFQDGAVHAIDASGSPIRFSSGDQTVDVKQVMIRWVPTPASTDSNKTINSGYNTFMTQEKAVLDLANRAEQLATSGRIGGTQQNLDAPNLVYLFMMYTNLTGEAVLRADTEEVNQTNAVLNEYATMQKIVNQTVANIKPTSDGKPGYGVLWGSNADGSFTDGDNAVLAMFTHGVPTGSGQSGDPPRSPIELMQNGFVRPYLTHGKNDSQTSSQWSVDGTSLSDAVTQLNQASQLKMNDINSETKQKDREFDLANTALQKMNEIVNKIAAAM